MILDTVSKYLIIDLDAAKTTTDMSWVVSYVDMASGSTDGKSVDGTTNGTTVTTILASPPSGSSYKVNFISVTNVDSAPKGVAIGLVNGTTVRPMIGATLQVNDSLYYTDIEGPFVVNANGEKKISAITFSSTTPIMDGAAAVGVGQTAARADHVHPSDTSREVAANKDASGGYVGLTLMAINFWNSAKTFMSNFTNANTAARTYTFQDRNGTIADDTDLALKAPIASPTFTGTIGIPETGGSAAPTVGVIYKGANSFIHNFNYGNNGTVTTSGYNIFIGTNAGNLTMGSTATLSSHSSYNSFIGPSAGFSNTTGYSNNFIGVNTGYLNTTGYSNSFIGANAGRSNTTGYSNSFIGANAGRSNTTGNYNNFIGMNAGFSNTTGYYNSFIGSYAGYDIVTTTQAATTIVNGTSYQIVQMGTTTSAQWIASGAVTGTIGETFTANATAGVGTGTVATTANIAVQCLNNSLIGYNTGRGIVTGSGNTIVGSNVSGLATGLTNNIILASGAGTIKAQHDGTNWALTGDVAVTGAISVITTIKTGGYTVATLPAGTVGQRAYVTDATAPTWNGALTGGGAVVVPVFRNATVWVSA